MTGQITKTERMRLGKIFSAGAVRVPEKCEYWIGGHDAGESYCFDCAEKKVAELFKKNPNGEYEVDGGWGTEGDYTPSCETCGHRLDNSLTQCGCEEEVRHFLCFGFSPNCDHDCCDMDKVLGSAGWDIYFEKDKQYFDDFYKLCRIILGDHFWIMPDNDYRHMWN